MHNEHYIQNQIRLWCGEHGFKCYRCNVGKILTAQNTYFDTGLPEGFPDLMITIPGGYIVYCECKTAKGRQREAQKRFQTEAKRDMIPYLLSHSLDEFIEQFTSLPIVKSLLENH